LSDDPHAFKEQFEPLNMHNLEEIDRAYQAAPVDEERYFSV
jgi:hypothetical protein